MKRPPLFFFLACALLLAAPLPAQNTTPAPASILPASLPPAPAVFPGLHFAAGPSGGIAFVRAELERLYDTAAERRQDFGTTDISSLQIDSPVAMYELVTTQNGPELAATHSGMFFYPVQAAGRQVAQVDVEFTPPGAPEVTGIGVPGSFLKGLIQMAGLAAVRNGSYEVRFIHYIYFEAIWLKSTTAAPDLIYFPRSMASFVGGRLYSVPEFQAGFATYLQRAAANDRSNRGLLD
jgi:hypothetical protein